MDKRRSGLEIFFYSSLSLSSVGTNMTANIQFARSRQSSCGGGEIWRTVRGTSQECPGSISHQQRMIDDFMYSSATEVGELINVQDAVIDSWYWTTRLKLMFIAAWIDGKMNVRKWKMLQFGGGNYQVLDSVDNGGTCRQLSRASSPSSLVWCPYVADGNTEEEYRLVISVSVSTC